MRPGCDSRGSAGIVRWIGFWGAVAVMIGVIIGSGIFNTPTVAAKNMGRPGLILVMWGIGGLLALFGALTYAELCTRYPRSGGMYVFLKEGFRSRSTRGGVASGGLGPPLAFSFGWTYMLITKPFAAAGIMVPGADHILKLAGFADTSGGTPELLKLGLTTVLLVLFTAVNIPGVRLGTGLAGVLTSIKFAALALIVLVALSLRKGSAANFAPVAVSIPLITAIGTTMSAILWTYDGWADVGSISGEVEKPRRNLPLMFVAGVAAVTTLYIAVNAVFMWMLPMGEMAGSKTVAPLVAERLVGGIGGTVVTALVVVSTLGSSHASIITGARVTFAQARDGLLFGSLGKIHARYQTPAVALCVQCGLSIIAVWTLKTFENLANGFVFTMWIFYGLAGVSLLLMRRRDRLIGASGDGRGEFRCPGYPLVPVLFILSALAMTVLSVIGNPWQTLPWLGVLVAGWPMYYVWRAFTNRATSEPRIG